MRVSAGEAKGRKLEVPKTGTVRPTQDRVREAIFNALGAPVVGARVLDLFAGAGGLGIEALSRGAVRVVFVEQDARVARALRSNVTRLDFAARSEVWRSASLRAIRELNARGERFDVVLMDPPYGTKLATETLAAVCASDLTDDDAIVIVETHVKDVLAVPAGWERSRERRYGDTLVTFVRRASAGMDRPAPDPNR